MIEAIVIGIIVAAILCFAIFLGKAKQEALQAKNEAADAERANEILVKSATRTPERVQRLDDAGYRD